MIAKRGALVIRNIAAPLLAITLAMCSGGGKTVSVLPAAPSSQTQPRCVLSGCGIPKSETLYVMYNFEGEGPLPDQIHLYDVASGAELPSAGLKTMLSQQMDVTSDRRYMFVGCCGDMGEAYDFATGRTWEVPSAPFTFSGDERRIFFVGGFEIQSTTIPPSSYTTDDIDRANNPGPRSIAADKTGANIFILNYQDPNTYLEFYDTVANKLTATLNLPDAGGPLVYDALSNQLYLMGGVTSSRATLIVVDAATRRVRCTVDLGARSFPNIYTLAMNRSGSRLLVISGASVTDYRINADGSAVTLAHFMLDGTDVQAVAVNDAATHLFVDVTWPASSIEAIEIPSGRVIRRYPDDSIVSIEPYYSRLLKDITVR